MGNLEARRDWGFAGDYVEGMWLMLQQRATRRLCAGNGREPQRQAVHRCRGAAVWLRDQWHGKGEAETGIDRNSGRTVVRIDKQNFRPAEVSMLIGNSDKARDKLGWKRRVTLDELVTLMAETDDRRVRDGGPLL